MIKNSIMDMVVDGLREAQADHDPEVPFLQGAVVTPAGRTHMMEMLQHAKEELDRIIARRDSLRSPSLSWYSFDSDAKTLTSYIHDVEQFLAEYVIPPSFKLSSVFTHTVEFVTYLPNDGIHPRVMILSRDVWEFIGEPHDIYLDKSVV